MITIEGPAMLEWLRTRRSVREMTAEPIAREQLERLLDAAITAPSSTNRQPWRFAVITHEEKRRAIANAVREKTQELKTIIQRGHHAADFGQYGDFFFEPLERATAIIIPQYRTYPDLIAAFIESGGGDPREHATPDQMQTELCATSAAIMTLLLQAHAEGLGACWMAGPMVARTELEAMLEIKDPWRMIGAIALGHPAKKSEPTPRKSLDKIVRWYE
jgi:F420 biosynthesis protein FbiB-like protein